MSEIADVSKEFIDDNKKLCQTMPNSRKGGRYSKKSRQERRNEVRRLHFDLGYSARKISDLMEINRNTINDDIKFLYSELKKDWNKLDAESLIMKQILRIEDQRNRLLKQLENIESFDSKLSIEKMIMDIDNRQASMYLKLRKTVDEIYSFAREVINTWLEEENLDVRINPEHQMRKITKSTYDKIKELIEKDQVPWSWQGQHKENKR